MIIDLGKVAVTAEGNWRNNKSYEALTCVVNDAATGGDGCGYISLKANIGVRPGTDPTVWQKAVEAGSSIYELCVKHGTFVGTEEEFVAAYNAAVQAAIDAAASAERTESAIELAERTRETNEGTRQTNEETRETNEGTRQSNEETRETNEAARQENEETRERTFAHQASAMSTALELAENAIGDANEAAGAASAAAIAANNAAAATAQLNAGLMGLKVYDGQLILVQNAETGTVVSGGIDGDGMVHIEFEV